MENPLSFRTNEYGNVIRTSRILHNWALRFALNRINGNPEKDHIENLKGASIYATPAIPIEVDYEFTTFHPFPEAPQMLKTPENLTPGSRKSYQGDYTILHFKEVVRVGSTFRFAVASAEPLEKELIITYGGKQTLQRVILEDADITEPEPIKGVIHHPINPLDFPDSVQLKNAFQHTIPPSPLFEGTADRTFNGRWIKRGVNKYVVPPSW